MSRANGEPLQVLRLCSVFEPPAEISARAVRFDPVGGMQNHTTSLTRALDDLGIAQTVVTTRPPGTPRLDAIGERATVHRLGLPVSAFRQLYSVPAARLAPRLARDADLVHVHLGEDLAVVPIGLAAARRHGLPLVMTVHTSLAHTVDGGGVRGAVLREAGGRLERLGARRATAVIALTPRLARLLEADGIPPARIHVIPSGVVARSRPPVPSPELGGAPGTRVLFVGRLHEQKGVRYLVEAAARLCHRDARVFLVGDGPERAALEKLARRLGVADRVIFLGFRPHAEVPGLMAAADVLVLPSIYEELGSVLLEAMQAGLPIVASRTGGVADAIADAGVLVAPRDPTALARAVDALLADPGERDRLRAVAIARSEDFHWDRLARRVLSVYAQVTARAPAQPSPDGLDVRAPGPSNPPPARGRSGVAPGASSAG